MDSPSLSHKKENTVRGCLTFPGKIYPVYDGHNTVGRKPSAVINLKNVNISQQHAIITVVDEDTHFISDLRSSNGTTVDNRNLNPLKLYPLENGALIKFADISCTYKRLNCSELLLDTSELSQDVTQNFYAAGTQAMHMANSDEMSLNEMATQVISPLEIHEMQTQVVLPLSINELPTQTMNFDESLRNISNNDSLDFMTMKKTSEIQDLASSNKEAPSKSTEEPHASAPLSQESDIVPVKLNSFRKISDSEAPTADIKSTILPSNKPESDKETQSSQIYPVKTGVKNVIESDSETEEYVPSTSGRRSRYMISDDDETDIEDYGASEAQVVQKPEGSENNPTQNPSFSDSFRLEVSGLTENQDKKGDEQGPKEETLVKDKEESSEAARCPIAEDHLYCRSLDNGLSNNVLENQAEDEKQTSITDTVPLQKQDNQESVIEKIGDAERSEVLVTKSESVQKNQVGDSLSDDETQDLIENPGSVSISSTNEKEEGNNNQDDGGVFDQPTQQLGFEFVNEERTEVKQEEEITKNKLDKEEHTVTDDIFVKPTQPLNVSSQSHKDDEDVYFQPTQEMPTLKEQPGNYSLVHDDDIYIQPTQEITPKLLASKIAEDTVHNSPQIEKSMVEESNKSMQEVVNDHDFLLPLPPLLPLRPSTSTSAPIEKLDDDELFLPPTQALEMLHKEYEDAEPHDAADKNLQSNEVEDQLQMLFASQSDHRFVATQQLIDVLEKKDDCDDIVDDSMVEGTSFSKWMSKKAQFTTVESIREVLDSSMLEDDVDKKKEKEKSACDGENKENLLAKSLEIGDEVKKQEEKADVKSRGKKTRKTAGNNADFADAYNQDKGSQSSVSSSGSSGSRSSSRRKNKVQEKENKEEIDTKVKTSKVSEDSVIETRKTTRKATEEKKGHHNEESSEEVDRKEKAGTSKTSKVSEETPTRRSTRHATEQKKDDINQGIEGLPERSTSRNAKTNAKTKKQEQNTRITRNSKLQLDQIEHTINTRKTKRKAETDVKEKSEEVTSGGDDDDDDDVSKRRKRREPTVASTTSEKSNNDHKVNVSERRKRHNSSSDEFMPKLSKTIPTTKGTGRSPNQKAIEEPTALDQEVQTPTPRRVSSRTRKDNVDDDVIVVSSTSTIAEVISVPSSSSTPIASQPTRRGRKLSANSRALKNQEGKHKKVEELSPILETVERSRRQLKPRVVFTMMDSPELESLIRQLGGTVVDTVDACTVLVTEQVKRSHKLLKAVGQGKPICSPQWLKACKKSSRFLDPWEYILVDKEAEKKWNFNLRASLERGLRTKLLQTYTFQVMVTAGADVVKGAIEACGGKWVARNLAKAESENLMIVATAEQKSKFSKVVKGHPEIRVVEPEAIFDGTLRQEFHFDQHLLT